ncbi:MAG TPA: SHOCT domain-containing protein [Ktedonobacteraceae bacterium]|jgi:putative membrane protein|nr:SHOCT domain-containing protein [Ktedonobacteraceae bacterium]
MHHWATWGMGFWPLFPLLWLAIIATLCWAASRCFGRRGRHAHFGPPFGPNALEILRQRYARGEIDGDTFEQMREHLQRSGWPRE